MTGAGPRTGPTSRQGLINRLRDGVVYNDSVRIGTSGDHDECATDALIDEAAEMIVKLEDALHAAGLGAFVKSTRAKHWIKRH